MRLKKKVALITGGGTGIGAATARLFASEGANVVVTGRRSAPIEAVASEVGGVAVAGDTSDPAHVEEAVAAAISAYGGIDVVVASAGVGFEGSVGDMDVDGWRRTLEINVNGPMLVSRAALPSMLERGGGSIVLVASTSGMASAPASAAYDVSKAALIALARSIAVSYGPRRVRANALCPGWVTTPMGDEDMDALGASRGLTREEAYRLATEDVPLRRPVSPEEMAACCLFLASDESSSVTGTTLVADGGGQAVEITSKAFGQD
jgi:meso-butanediol dehydrogenase/(S,S)-butanediol dehydrogenase/diacetyl reductase